VVYSKAFRLNQLNGLGLELKLSGVDSTMGVNLPGTADRGHVALKVLGGDTDDFPPKVEE